MQEAKKQQKYKIPPRPPLIKGGWGEFPFTRLVGFSGISGLAGLSTSNIDKVRGSDAASSHSDPACNRVAAGFSLRSVTQTKVCGYIFRYSYAN